MTALLDPIGNDAALTNALAGIIGTLRSQRYASIRDRLDEALRGEAEHFVFALAGHLDQEERVVFPALREAAPSHALVLGAIESQHERLRERARGLAAEIAGGEREAATETARIFLAELLEHIRREDDAVQQIVDRLDPPSLERFRKDVEKRLIPRSAS